MAYNMEDHLRKGPWEEEEDELLKAIVVKMGEGRWDLLAQASGLLRSGKSCRLRWLNYLRPNLKLGQVSVEEEEIIVQLQQLWGNKWSKIARMLPGRTDNEIKNYWRTRVRKHQAQIRKLEMYTSTSTEEHKYFGAGNQVESSSTSCEKQESKNCPDMFAQTISSEADSADFGAGSPYFGIAYSPYEARLSNYWMSDFPNNGQYGSEEQPETSYGYSFEPWDVSQETCYSLWD